MALKSVFALLITGSLLNINNQLLFGGSRKHIGGDQFLNYSSLLETKHHETTFFLFKKIQQEENKPLNCVMPPEFGDFFSKPQFLVYKTEINTYLSGLLQDRYMYLFKRVPGTQKYTP